MIERKAFFRFGGFSCFFVVVVVFFLFFLFFLFFILFVCFFFNLVKSASFFCYVCQKLKILKKE